MGVGETRSDRTNGVEDKGIQGKGQEKRHNGKGKRDKGMAE
jgi:hypothetical protein